MGWPPPAVGGIVNLLSGLFSSRSVCDTRHMHTPSTHRYKNHRFPAEIISHGVWLYFRVCLSYRDVEELLFARGIMVTYEAIRKWCRKFGQDFANQLRHRRPRPGDKCCYRFLGLVLIRALSQRERAGGFHIIEEIRYQLFGTADGGHQD
jgi:hypothetical protein